MAPDKGILGEGGDLIPFDQKGSTAVYDSKQGVLCVTANGFIPSNVTSFSLVEEPQPGGRACRLEGILGGKISAGTTSPMKPFTTTWTSGKIPPPAKNATVVLFFMDPKTNDTIQPAPSFTIVPGVVTTAPTPKPTAAVLPVPANTPTPVSKPTPAVAPVPATISPVVPFKLTPLPPTIFADPPADSALPKPVSLALAADSFVRLTAPAPEPSKTHEGRPTARGLQVWRSGTQPDGKTYWDLAWLPATNIPPSSGIGVSKSTQPQSAGFLVTTTMVGGKAGPPAVQQFYKLSFTAKPEVSAPANNNDQFNQPAVDLFDPDA